ncbi:beta-galactosidase trimerization domain-containing protein [Actinomadura syzygii]|nr:beta-galactosidase trimerization domain-containing protein [Actinomadura syzygii]
MRHHEPAHGARQAGGTDGQHAAGRHPQTPHPCAVRVLVAASGVVDEHDHVHLGGYPAPLRDALGIVVDEFWPIPDDASVGVTFGDRAVPSTLWSEWLEPGTVEPVALYGAGPFAGRPAVTRNAHGAGRAWYVSCHLGQDIGLVLDEALADAGVRPALDVPAGVEATRRDGPSASYLFLLNHRDAEGVLPVPDGVDLLTGTAVRGTLRLAPLGAAVLRTPSDDHPER